MKGKEESSVTSILYCFIEKIQKEYGSIICRKYRLLLQNQRIIDIGKILGLFLFPTKGNMRQCSFSFKVNVIIQVIIIKSTI